MFNLVAFLSLTVLPWRRDCVAVLFEDPVCRCRSCCPVSPLVLLMTLPVVREYCTLRLVCMVSELMGGLLLIEVATHLGWLVLLYVAVPVE